MTESHEASAANAASAKSSRAAVETPSPRSVLITEQEVVLKTMAAVQARPGSLTRWTKATRFAVSAIGQTLPPTIQTLPPRWRHGHGGTTHSGRVTSSAPGQEMNEMRAPLRGIGPPGDPYVMWDATYVLGSLSAAGRREFEGHLANCPECREAVADMSGVPALLSHLDRREVAAMYESGTTGSATPEISPDLLPTQGEMSRL